MQHAFFAFADVLDAALATGEQFTAWLDAETSDFVRFNHARVRQAGHVTQAYLTLRLVAQQKPASVTLALSGQLAEDTALVLQQLAELRTQLDDITADPHLLLCDERHLMANEDVNPRLDAAAIVHAVTTEAAGYDWVGILACGAIASGYASSTGSRLWSESTSFNLDWSVYAHGDKAVKSSYAGKVWDEGIFAHKLRLGVAQLALLERPAKTLAPGGYRAYFAPVAVESLLSMFNWGGWSEKQLRVKRSPLLKLQTGEVALSPLVTLTENTAEGLAPAFQGEGFLKPTQVPLITQGKLTGSLVSPRTAKEFALTANADAEETAQSLHMAAGELPEADVLQRLGTGLYVSNLWYLNFSDRMNARITGMTRFATFWVEDGQIVAPVNVMRFDDSLFRLLGEQLEALTVERALLVDTDTYGSRHTASSLLPGALVRRVELVL
jgi:predicted Zn-dependent protease